MTNSLGLALLPLVAASLTLAQLPFLPFKPFLPNDLIPISCPPRAANNSDSDFLILGAGLAGLGAAHFLHAHTRGCTIRIIEARNAPGGRVRTLEEGPFAGMEIGAGWIHEYKGNPMLAVADANGLYAKWVGGNSSYVGGDLIRVFDNGTELDEATRRQSHDISSYFTSGIEGEASRRLKYSLPDISVLESVVNLTSERHLTPLQKRLARWNLDVVYGGDWAAPMDELSVMSHQHGYLNYEGGDCVFPDGFLQIPRALALGIDIRFDQVVRNISWDGNRVQLTSRDGTVHRGRKLLLTQSIGVLQSDLLTFNPPLPENKRTTINKFGMAALNRVMLRFPRPFWTNDTYTLGFLPEMSSLFSEFDDDDDEDTEEWATTPLFSIAVNAAYEGRPVGSGGVLSFMVGGDSSAAILSRSQKKVVTHLMKLLRAAFGSDIPDPTHVNMSDWKAEPFARGSYAFLPVGTSLQEDVPALAEPIKDAKGEPRLFFAGEGTLVGPARGTTHGAFLSGIREAANMIGQVKVVERVWNADFASTAEANTMRGAADEQIRRGGIAVDDWFIPEEASKLVVQV